MDSIRKQVLDAAAGCVLQDRAAAYGSVEDNFGRIAHLWQAWLVSRYGEDAPMVLDSGDVAAMMSLVKFARAITSPQKMDNFTDIAGYAACWAEANGAKE